MKSGKSKTSIAIDTGLWSDAKAACQRRTYIEGKKISFSELVERALKAYLYAGEEGEDK